MGYFFFLYKQKDGTFSACFHTMVIWRERRQGYAARHKKADLYPLRSYQSAEGFRRFDFYFFGASDTRSGSVFYQDGTPHYGTARRDPCALFGE